RLAGCISWLAGRISRLAGCISWLG
ncbi:hypothetical protein BIW11_04741, partial [Tropilaelaps mercedesae]